MEYNPFSPEVQENPYPYYAYLRQQAPVYKIPGTQFWAVSRYNDVLYTLRNTQVFSSGPLYPTLLGESNPFPPEAPAIVSSDPPAHTRLRKLANRAFTPRRVAGLESRVREIVHHLLEQVAGQGEFDLIEDLASPLPIIVIAELLGIPVERRDDFRRWADAVIRSTNGATLSASARAEIGHEVAALRAYVQAVIGHYRREPADNLISDLVRVEEDSQMLTAEEVVSLIIMILIAGSETTANLIGNAMLALLDHPEQLATVRANPALVPNLVEETLRYDAIAQLSFRQTTHEVEIAGTTIPAGTFIAPLLGSANRDECRFPEPDRFDITRNTEGHVGFGFGIHFCLGAQLARQEAKVALAVLLEQFPHLSRTDAPVTWVESITIRGPKTLPLVVG